MWKKYKIRAKQSKAENFLKKYKIRVLKFIVLLLNCTLGPPNLEVGVPPGSASEVFQTFGPVTFESYQTDRIFTRHCPSDWHKVALCISTNQRNDYLYNPQGFNMVMVSLACWVGKGVDIFDIKCKQQDKTTFEFFTTGLSARLSDRSLHREEQKKKIVKNNLTETLIVKNSIEPIFKRHKNDNFDGMCERALTFCRFFFYRSGHAIIDGIKPNLLQEGLLEGLALGESFSDLTAVFGVLDQVAHVEKLSFSLSFQIQFWHRNNPASWQTSWISVKRIQLIC